MTNQNIEGIFKYCDRWCERCTFTSRCAIYEDETNLSPEERDITNKVFWDRIGENLAKAQELLMKAASEQGIDLTTITAETEDERARRTTLRTETRQHPLAVLSLEYSKIGRAWLTTQPGMLDRLETLKSELILGVESEEGAKRETAVIRDSLAVIQWYLVFIHVKLTRALTGKAKYDITDKDYGFPHDFDGSAKIACIAIDRSMNSWAALFEILPEHEDHFYKVLSMLERIKTMTLEEFPGALSFTRPGFDA